MNNLRTILHPTDFSNSSMFAFGLAWSLAKSSGAELLVVHVASCQDRSERQSKVWHDALSRLTCVDPSVNMRSWLLEGDAASQIIGAAIEANSDLIVMGTNGRSDLNRLWFGSVAAAVRKDAPCPVVAVQLPNGAGWNLPNFSDEEAVLSNQLACS